MAHGSGRELLVAVEHETHRPLGFDGQRSRDHLVAAGLGLGPEAASDGHGVSADLVHAEVEHVGDLFAHEVRRLSGHPKIELLAGRVPTRHRRVRLQAHMGGGLVVVVAADGDLGLGARRAGVAVAANRLHGEVPDGVVVHGRGLAGPGGLSGHRAGPRLVDDVDQIERGRGLGRGAGRHCGHLLTDEPDPASRQREPVAERLTQVQVGAVCDVVGGDHRGHSAEGLGPGRVDAADVGVGVGAAQDAGLEHSGQHHVGGVDGRAGGPFVPLVGPNPLAQNGQGPLGLWAPSAPRRPAETCWTAATTPL